MATKALRAVRDGLKGVRSDLVDVAAEMADDLGQRIDNQSFEIRKQTIDQIAILADAVRGLQGHGPEAGVLRGKGESWLSLLGAQGDLLQSQHTQLGVMADRLKTLFDRQERVADRDAEYHKAELASIGGIDAESESRHQSIIAYLKALEAKIDALETRLGEVDDDVSEVNVWRLGKQPS